MQDVPTNPFLTTDGKRRKSIEISPIASPAKAKARPNLAIYVDDQIHPVLQGIIQRAERTQSAYDTQRDDYIGLWEQIDNAYWMAQKESRLPQMTLAKVSASVLYRTNRRLANGANLATFPGGFKKIPIQFTPKQNVFDDTESRQIAALKAQALNSLALEHMERAGVESKRSSAYHNVYKYHNAIFYVPWEYEIEKRKRWTEYDPNETLETEDGVSFVHKDTGEVQPQRFPNELVEEEYDYVCKDGMGFYPRPLRDIWLDRDIDDLNRQTAFFDRSDMVRSEIWKEARSGRYQNTEKINKTHEYGFYDKESQVENQEKQDAGESAFHATETERYERWRCWLMLPKLKYKVKNGTVTDLEFDQNAEPCRYLLEMVGKLGKGAIPVRFCESPYWGHGIPYISAHSHDDDVGFYHRGLYNLLEDNITQEQIAKGQYIDNKTLQNLKPLKRLKGRCFTTDMRIVPNKVFDVASTDALTEFDIKDNTSTFVQVLAYLENDSEKLANTPKFMLGEAMGSRTSATEFAQVRDSGSAPALNDIKTLNTQIWGGFMCKLKEYIPQFQEKPVKSGNYEITPDEFQDVDLILEEVATTEFENRQMGQQIIINLAQVMQGPIFQGIVNPAGFLQILCSQFPSIFTNPEMLLLKNDMTRQLLLEFRNQEQVAPAQPEGVSAPGGTPSQIAPPMSEGQGMAAQAGAARGV